MDRRTLLVRTLIGFAQLAVMVGLCLFWPAGTWHYWQAWAFIAVFLGASAAITGDLLIHDPALVERRLRAGPTAEAEPRQRLIQALAGLASIACLVVPALDHRLGWSHLPGAAALAGDALVALGFVIIYRVFRENTFTAATIQVAEHQSVVSTGPYAVVRHPMYAGAIPLFIGIPLALGSLVAIGLVVPAIAVIVWRLLEEEKFLVANLPGYAAYRTQTRYRLIPYLW